jgi:hypothetical protein
MTEPIANEPDLAEQQQTPTREPADAARPEVPLGTPEADALEQALPAADEPSVAGAGTGDGTTRDRPLEAEPADTAEQALVVGHDEDEYR